MDYIWWTCGCLIITCGILLREVFALRFHLGEMQCKWEADSELRRTLAKICNDTERQSASNNAALELLEVSVDNHERYIQADVNLKCLEAEQIMGLEARILRLERPTYHLPARRDN